MDAEQVKAGFVALAGKINNELGVLRGVERRLHPRLPAETIHADDLIGNTYEDPLLAKYRRFVPVAESIANLSKMTGTRVGCVVLGEGFEMLSSGWNGAPRGSDADHSDDIRIATRESRLDWVCHAEANAIANAARSGTSLNYGTMIVTLMPCMTCAKLAVQAGIQRVICPAPDADNERWGREFDLTKQLFAEVGVQLDHYTKEKD